MMRYVVDTDILANIQRAGHAGTLGGLGPLPVVITDTVWDELTVNARLNGAAPRLVKEADDMLRAIAGAPMMLTPQSPEARTLVQLQLPPPTEGLGEHSVIAYAFHHGDVTAVLNDRRALHRGIEELHGRVVSWHGFLDVLRAGHGLTKRASDELSSWYCSRFVPQRAPIWW
jgi:hypothetical protein